MQTAGLELEAYLQVCFKIFLIIKIKNNFIPSYK